MRIRFLLALGLVATTAVAQTFDVASVRQNKSGSPPKSNFPLGPGDAYTPNGGLFSATGFPLVTYIAFAYKVSGNQARSVVRQLPDWATTDRFDIQARAQGSPGKDEMRLMMRSLLADRFKAAIRSDTREVPVLAFVLAKPGKTGPQLQPHPGDLPCSTTLPPGSAQSLAPAATVVGGFPALCGGLVGMAPTQPGRMRLGGRNVTLEFLAQNLSNMADFGRPMVDGTGLTGTFDFILEFTPETNDPTPPDPSGPSFEEALRDQWGVKFQSQKAAMSFLVVDHVEHPSEN